jgi:sugar phosphate isomerase/epimerase
MTLGGVESKASLEDRAAAAAAAGFQHLGWMSTGYLAERAAGRSDTEMRAILAHYGIDVPEIEFLYGWATDGDPGFDWHELERDLFTMAEVFGADHINCGDVGVTGPMLPLEAVIERFAGICDRAAEHGVRMAIEFLPFSQIPDASTAWQIIHGAGRPNAGLDLDTWHHFRGANDLEQVLAVPPERVIVIQFDDAGPPAGDPWADTMERRLPGEGLFDLVGFIEALDAHGVRAPISVEVFSTELNALSPKVAAQRAYDASRNLLSRARI